MARNLSFTAMTSSTVCGDWRNASDVTTAGDQWALAEEASVHRAELLWPVLLYLGLLLPTGLLGNGLVLYVHAAKFRSSSTRSYVLALAVLDLASCLLAVPAEILDLRMAFTFRERALCKTMRAVASFVLVASGMTLTVVAVDRYRHICRAMGPQLTSRSACWMVACACVVSMLVSWPAAVLYGLKPVEDELGIKGMECSTDEVWEGTKWPLIYTLVLAAVFITALVVMTVIYILIGRQVFKQDRFRARMRQRSVASGDSEGEPQGVSRGEATSDSPAYDPPSQAWERTAALSRSPSDVTRKASDSTQGRKKSIFRRFRSSSGSYSARTRRTTFMLFLITLIFVLSFLPHLALKAARALDKGWLSRGGVGGLVAYNLLVRSYFLNSVSNAFVYGFCSPAFRQQCRLLLASLSRRKPRRTPSIPRSNPHKQPPTSL